MNEALDELCLLILTHNQGPFAPAMNNNQELPTPTPEHTMVLNACFEARGVWAGVEDLVEHIYLDLLSNKREDILELHNYELYMVLFKYRDKITLKYASLTDSSSGVEKTRNFPLDRAYRVVHGLVGLVLDWLNACVTQDNWTIIVEKFDDAQHLAKRFFIELGRRTVHRSDIITVIQTRQAPDTFEFGVIPAPLTYNTLLLDQSIKRPLQQAEAEYLEQMIATNRFEAVEECYPILLSYYRHKGDDRAAAILALKALCLYNHYGYYHESAGFVETVLPQFSNIVPDQEARWNYVGNIFQGLVMIGRQDKAHAIIEQLAEPYLTDPALQAKMNYVLAMIHLRYSAIPNMALAEEHILKAKVYIDRAEGSVEPDDFHFFKVFIDNGLAFLRVRQNRKAEALQLCQSGYEHLTKTLGEARHQLHRSVLQYNSAQVYVALGKLDEALLHYGKAIEMDPYYSEYYNESANIFQQQEQYEEALATYKLAIHYSAPYPEVFFNTAICHVHLNQEREALEYLNMSLDLAPDQPEAYLLRSELLSMLNHDAEALIDLNTAILRDSNSIAARVNRAVLHYNAASYELALADMDYVITIDANNADHHKNRDQIYKAMSLAQV